MNSTFVGEGPVLIQLIRPNKIREIRVISSLFEKGIAERLFADVLKSREISTTKSYSKVMTESRGKK